MSIRARGTASGGGRAATPKAVVRRRRRGLVTTGGMKGRRGAAANGRTGDRIDQAALSAARVLVARLGSAVDPRALVEALSENRELDRVAKDFISTHSGITTHVGSSRPATGSEPIRAGLQPKEVATMLGVDKSTVSRYTRSGKLYAIDVDGRHRYPPWQFVSNQPLPGIGTVSHALPDGWGPVPFARFMTTSDEALGGHSPVEWLTAGGTPQRIVTLLEEEARA